jgi:hypothetical protein
VICRNYWWIIAFTFITLVGLAAVAAAKQLKTVGMGFMAWLAVLAVLWINSSDSFLGIKDANIFSVVSRGAGRGGGQNDGNAGRCI